MRSPRDQDFPEILHDKVYEPYGRANRLCAEVERQRALARAVQVFVPGIDLAEARELIAGLADACAGSVTFVLVDGLAAAVGHLADAVM
jgi:hypothetical protein